MRPRPIFKQVLLIINHVSSTEVTSPPANSVDNNHSPPPILAASEALAYITTNSRSLIHAFSLFRAGRVAARRAYVQMRCERGG